MSNKPSTTPVTKNVRNYTFPETGQVVEAASLAEAVEIAKKSKESDKS